MFFAILIALLFFLPAMSFFPSVGTFVAKTLGIRPEEPTAANGSASASASPNPPDDGSFQPSPMDIVVVKAMLSNGLRLPHEIVLSVLDFAEYWPHTSTVLDHSMTVSSGRNREDQFVLRSKPLGLIKKVHYNDHDYSFTGPQPLPLSDDGQYPLSQYQEWIGGPTDTLEHPCRKIVFTIRSRDQGWGGTPGEHGTYNGSWTWFEAGLERFDRNATNPKNSPEKDAAVDEAGESSTNGPKEVPPNPYFPVYGMRSVYPIVKAEVPTFYHDLHPSPEHTIQKNKAATRQATTHKVVWSWKDDIDPLTAEQLAELGRGVATGNGDFVRNLELGDVVTIWAKARFGGWTNFVERVSLDIYWAL